MKRLNLLLVLGIFCWPIATLAQLQLLPDAQPQIVFGGGARSLELRWHNAGIEVTNAEITARMFQTSSATAVKLVDVPWKKLSVLPGQTVMESAQLDFPAVTAETKFLVQWIENTNHVLGKTEVLVYPTNLLAELKPLTGDAALGIFDPQNQIKPLLKNLKMGFADLENSGLENFSGRLAIIGPFSSKAKMHEELAGQIHSLAKAGVAIVWLQPPLARGGKLSPSFYSVPGNPNATNAVVIVQPELVANLADNPQAQLNLIYFCRLALNPQPLTFPGPSTQP
jgi:hypothetical protein